MTRLFCDWKQRPVPGGIRARHELGGYLKLMELWRSDDAVAVRDALGEACDLHTRLSHDDDENTFDFSDEVYRIYPVEILAVVRLRTGRGLATQVPPHPLMEGPLAQLPEVMPCVPDPFLRRVIDGFSQRDLQPA